MQQSPQHDKETRHSRVHFAGDTADDQISTADRHYSQNY